MVVPGSSPSLLGIPNIKTLGVLTITYETIGRQGTPDDNPDKKQRNCQSEKAVQTEGSKPESCTNKRQDADAQKQCSEDNMSEWSFTPNPIVMGTNNNDISFFTEPMNNDNKSFFHSQ